MNQVRVAAHGLIKKDGRFLATKRSKNDSYMPGLWDIPGGTIEFQEHVMDALNREICEETGLQVKVGKILYCYDSASTPGRHHFQVIYECEYDGGKVVLSEDHDDYQWVNLEEARSLDKIAFLESLCDYITHQD